MNNIDETLKERGNRYGSFESNAECSQSIKQLMRNAAVWDTLDNVYAEALEMIALKISRILTGDANYADSWHDIAGYATLVKEYINGPRPPVGAGKGMNMVMDKVNEVMQDAERSGRINLFGGEIK